MRVHWGALALVPVVALALGLDACGSPTPSPQQHLSVPTFPSGQPASAMRAITTGRLSGRVDTQHGQACLWLGSGGDRTVLLWPAGYVAENDPLRVLNRTGRVVGKVGEEVTLGGGASVIGPATAGLGACGAPRPSHGWIVADVLSGPSGAAG